MQLGYFIVAFTLRELSMSFIFEKYKYPSCLKEPVCEQVTPAKPQHVEKAEPVAPKPQTESTKQATVVAQNTPSKVDCATDLFNLLSMDTPVENGSEEASTTTGDRNWEGFQSAAEAFTTEKIGSTKAAESNLKSNCGIEDLFNDSPSVTPFVPVKLQKDLKNDIMSLIEKEEREERQHQVRLERI